MRRHDDPKLEQLRAVPLLATASHADLRALAAAGDVVAVPAGHRLLLAGHRTNEAFLLLDGIVVAGSPVRSGELVGVVEVLDGQPAAVDAVAVTDATALVLSGPRLRALMETNHVVRVAVVRQLADRARQLDRLLAATAA